MYHLICCGLILMALIVSGCEMSTPSGDAIPNGQSVSPTAVLSPLPRPSPTVLPYPAPDSEVPIPDGYPVSPLPVMTPIPYPQPAGEVWIIKPVGQQCAPREDAVDLQTVVADLIAIGVPVSTRELVQFDVCQACGCPTATHFRVQVPAAYLPRVAALGWQREVSGDER